MSNPIKHAVEGYTAAWAERDPARRADLLASAVTDDAGGSRGRDSRRFASESFPMIARVHR